MARVDAKVEKVLQALPVALAAQQAAARPLQPPAAIDRSSMNALALVETELLEDSDAALALEDESAHGRAAAAASMAAANAMRIPELLKQLTNVLGSAGEMHRRSEDKTVKVC